MKRLSVTIILALFSITFLTGFFGAKGDTAEEQRKNIQKMRTTTLSELYKLSPTAEKEVKNSAGYAVFNNTGVNVLLVSTANGYGVAKNNKNGQDTYMNMASGGVGVGLGVKDFRGIFIFTTEKAYNEFVNTGWTAGAQADAAAKADDQGDAVATAIDVGEGVKLYQMTKNGLALQATIQGTKYWQNDDLN